MTKKNSYYYLSGVVFLSLCSQALSTDTELSPEEKIGIETRRIVEKVSLESERIVDQIQRIEPEKIEKETKRVEQQVQSFFRGFRKK